MIVLTRKGLYCPAGNFYIDPNGAVENAVVTHAHSDHARRGSTTYFCVRSGAGLMRVRLGKSISIKAFEFGERFRFNNIEVSFHSAGHILGSAQVRLSNGREVWVSSGDYKREPDPTCEPFESVKCDTFITEATFGTPSFIWNKSAEMGREIFEWWAANAAAGYNSVLFAYSLGKAQRVLGLLAPHAVHYREKIYCHPAARELNHCYREEGVELAEHICLSQLKEKTTGALFLVPQAFLKSPQASVLGQKFRTAFASGWMSNGPSPFSQTTYDRGFTLSDHADWNDLVRTIVESQAKTVYVQHRGQGALVRHLRGLGLKALPEAALAEEEVVFNARQMELF